MWHGTSKSASCDAIADRTYVPRRCRVSADSAPGDALRRQNTFLRGRVARLSEAQRAEGLAAIGAAEDFRDALGTLCPQLSELRAAHARMARQLAESRRRAEEAEAKAREANARAERSAARFAMESQRKPQKSEGPLIIAEQNAQLREEICALHIRAAALTEARDAAVAARVEADARVERISAQLAEANAARDAMESEKKDRDAQDTAAARVEAASRAVLASMSLSAARSCAKGLPAESTDHTSDNNNSSSSDGVSECLWSRLDALLSRVALLEGGDLQLRQRGDAIAILQDERAELQERVAQLRRTLSNLSELFASMPQTPAELEETVMERDVLRAALHRCEARAEVPCAAEIRRIVELRCAEVAARRTSSPLFVVLEEPTAPCGGAEEKAQR